MEIKYEKTEIVAIVLNHSKNMMPNMVDKSIITAESKYDDVIVTLKPKIEEVAE